jgi:hypothetical protein
MIDLAFAVLPNVDDLANPLVWEKITHDPQVPCCGKINQANTI